MIVLTKICASHKKNRGVREHPCPGVVLLDGVEHQCTCKCHEATRLVDESDARANAASLYYDY